VARRRGKRSRWARLIGFLVVVGCVSAVWYGSKHGWKSPDEPESAITLKSEIDPDSDKVALKKVDTPATDSKSPEKGSSGKTRKAPDKKALEELPNPPSTQPARGNTLQAGVELRAAEAAQKGNYLISARSHFNRALQSGLNVKEAQRVRKQMADLADKTVFSLRVTDNDPLVGYHVVNKGEYLATIAKRYKISDDLLAQINNIQNKNRIWEGQRLKIIKGPFHALIDKSDHLLHVHLQDVYVRSYRVALGANGSTPTGKWRVGTRQKNPMWVDPKTHKRWASNDPKNPIGEYWISLKGTEGNAMGQVGYGIHGTIEPKTIGQDVSLGCIRLAPKDIETVYKMLMSGHSMVTVVE